MAWGKRGGNGGRRNNRRGGGGDREFVRIAQIALWKSDGRSGGPVLYGSVEDEDGNEIGRISLWKSTSDHSKAPVLTGSITREKGQGGDPEEFDDDISDFDF